MTSKDATKPVQPVAMNKRLDGWTDIAERERKSGAFLGEIVFFMVKGSVLCWTDSNNHIEKNGVGRIRYIKHGDLDRRLDGRSRESSVYMKQTPLNILMACPR